MIEIREAELDDYELLLPFYRQAYRPNHPFLNLNFFSWQFGQSHIGKALVAIDDQKVVGHLGCNFADGFNWLTNLFILETYRSGPIVMALYSRAKKMGFPLVTTNANDSVVELYRRMKWYKQPNLERFCLINPIYKLANPDLLVSKGMITEEFDHPQSHHYWHHTKFQENLIS